MMLANLPIILRLLCDGSIYRFIARLYKLRKKSRSIMAYLKYLAKFCAGEKIVYGNGKYVINSLIPPIPSQAFFNFLHALNGKGDILTAFAQGDIQAPISTYLKITNNCDCSCFYCSAHGNVDNQRQLSYEDWKRVIAELQDLGVSYIGFTGGEPLLYPEIEKLLATVDQRSASILFTNGIHLTYEKAKILKDAGLFAISISLDSADKQKHNQTRGNPLAFDLALRAIANARKAGLYTIVQPVLCKTELTWSKFSQLVNLVKRRGAHEIRIHKPAPAGRISNIEGNDQIIYSDTDCGKLYALQLKANRKLSMPKVSSFPYTEGPERFGCNAGIFHSYISSTGELTPCDFIPLTFGNVLNNKISDLYETMKKTLGKRKISCMAAQVSATLCQRNSHSHSLRESQEICQEIESKIEAIPKFFRETSGLL